MYKYKSIKSKSEELLKVYGMFFISVKMITKKKNLVHLEVAAGCFRLDSKREAQNNIVIVSSMFRVKSNSEECPTEGCKPHRSLTGPQRAKRPLIMLTIKTRIWM